MRRPTYPSTLGDIARLTPTLALAVALAAPASAQEQPPAVQPPGRQPPAGRQPVPEQSAPAPALPVPSPPDPAPPVEAAGRAPAPVPRTAMAAAPAPATLMPAEQVRVQMPRLFGELAGADAAVRESARAALMGMAREDLPAFEQLVRDSVPLVPAQAAVLREIVTQVFLAGEDYDVAAGQPGFLGVRLATVTVVSGLPDEAEAAPPAVPGPAAPELFESRRPLPAGTQTTGVLILDRMPGFNGARTLRDGDVVLGVVELPDHPTFDHGSMTRAIGSFGAGETIHLQVLRQGQVVRLPVTPGPRPMAVVDPFNNAMEPLLDRRKKQVESYWEQTFAPLLKEGVG